jgi:hypothetical protein
MGDNYTPRDPFAENEGFEFVANLEDSSIISFRKQANRLGFARWKDISPPGFWTWLGFVVDGGCSIIINFSDGTQKEFDEYSLNTPTTWDYMDAAFKKLTGENILSVDWR